MLLCVAALLADGCAPWRIGEVSVPLRLQHDLGVVTLTADGEGTPPSWHLSGDLAGELHAQRRGDLVHAGFDGRALAGAVSYAGDRFTVHFDGRMWSFGFAAPPSAAGANAAHAGATAAHVTAPMPGKIIKVAVRDGDEVEEHALLAVLEAMKMEHRIEASAAATVKAVLVEEGQIVTAGTPLVELA